jgi:hypothetical protein
MRQDKAFSFHRPCSYWAQKTIVYTVLLQTSTAGRFLPGSGGPPSESRSSRHLPASHGRCSLARKNHTATARSNLAGEANDLAIPPDYPPLNCSGTSITDSVPSVLVVTAPLEQAVKSLLRHVSRSPADDPKVLGLRDGATPRENRPEATPHHHTSLPLCGPSIASPHADEVTFRLR